jgi:hypothetical protein
MMGFLLGLLIGSSAGSLSADDEPFSVRSHPIDGQIHQVWPLQVARCDGPASDLLVLLTRGRPPRAEKHVLWMPCGSALTPGDPRIVSRRLPDDAVLVDIARQPDQLHAELFIASSAGLRIESLSTEAIPARMIPVAGGLALPDRPWELSRIPIVADWHDLGQPTALLPAAGGAILLDLETGTTRPLPLPVFADYRTWVPDLPETEERWLVARTRWPALAQGDENGDGRMDLIAISRWAVWVYHTDDDGLPSAPDRRLELVPFDEETEREWERTATQSEARDVDGDGRADLLLSTVEGGLNGGRTHSRLLLNRGEGLDPERPADAERVMEGGFSSFTFLDVDGDGRDELLETSIEFGALQIVRFLLTRSTRARIRLLELDTHVEGGWRVEFEDDLVFRLDFEAGATRGLVPMLGDWNGDGLLDFYVPDGDDAIGFRIGARAGDTLRFESTRARVGIPLSSGQSRIADLDGDGLDEIIAFDPRTNDAPLLVLENEGRLPGTRPHLEPADDRAPTPSD